jgi:hypothetical protein
MRASHMADAARFAANVLPIIHEVQAAGHISCNAIAGQLNTRKVATDGHTFRCARFWSEQPTGSDAPLLPAALVCREDPTPCYSSSATATGRRSPTSYFEHEPGPTRGEPSC